MVESLNIQGPAYPTEVEDEMNTAYPTSQGAEKSSQISRISDMPDFKF